jgi:putative membrane protein
LPRYAAVCAAEAAVVVAMAAAIGVTGSYDVNLAVLGLFTFSVSLCFMLIMQFLNLTFDLVGKALAILVLLVQLVGAGGTLPIDLGQTALSSIKPWLPFTYAVDIFREAITYGNVGTMGQDLLVLAGMGLGCLALSVACWPIACRVRDRLNAREPHAGVRAKAARKAAEREQAAEAF